MTEQIVSPERFLELYEVDVSQYTTSYSGFDYIRNGYVPYLLNKYLPGVEVEFENNKETMAPLHYLADGSAYVICYLRKGALTSPPLLYPIMGNPPKDASINNPNSRDLNDNMARAGVKCLAFHTGLGLKLFTREDDVKPETKTPSTTKTSGKPSLF